MKKWARSSLQWPSACPPAGTDQVTLPISRYGIADYLVVSVEIVSRELRELKQRGIIRIAGTRVIQIAEPCWIASARRCRDESRRRLRGCATASSKSFCEDSEPDSLGQLTHTQAIHHARPMNFDGAHADAEVESDDFVRVPSH